MPTVTYAWSPRVILVATVAEAANPPDAQANGDHTLGWRSGLVAFAQQTRLRHRDLPGLACLR